MTAASDLYGALNALATAERAARAHTKRWAERSLRRELTPDEMGERQAEFAPIWRELEEARDRLADIALAIAPDEGDR